MTFSDIWWRFLIVFVACYLAGNFNSAITISKIKSKDIRKMGSGNPGTMNMSRNFGLKIGILVFVLDVLKGVIPTLTVKLLFLNLHAKSMVGEPITICAESLAGLSVVLGHVFPMFYGFKGGKGIASTIGALLVINWQFSLISLVLALIFIFATKMGAVGSFIATTPTVIATLIKLYYDYFVISNVSGYFIFASMLLFLFIFVTWLAHRRNIKQLLSCEEHDTNWLQMIKNIKFKSKLKKRDIAK